MELNKFLHRSREESLDRRQGDDSLERNDRRRRDCCRRGSRNKGCTCDGSCRRCSGKNHKLFGHSGRIMEEI